MLPSAPGFASTTIGWPSAALTRSAMSRDTTSSCPPAGNGTIRWMGSAGHAGSACALCAMAASTQSSIVANVRRIVLSNGFIVAKAPSEQPSCARSS
jgi:hypothetical protein